MPNIKSAIKRVKVTKAKKEQNKMIKSRISTQVKKFKLAVEQKELANAEELYKQTVSLIDKAAKTNIFHKNAASRKQAKLAVLLNSIKEEK